MNIAISPENSLKGMADLRSSIFRVFFDTFVEELKIFVWTSNRRF